MNLLECARHYPSPFAQNLYRGTRRFLIKRQKTKKTSAPGGERGRRSVQHKTLKRLQYKLPIWLTREDHPPPPPPPPPPSPQDNLLNKNAYQVYTVHVPHTTHLRACSCWSTNSSSSTANSRSNLPKLTPSFSSDPNTPLRRRQMTAPEENRRGRGKSTHISHALAV